MFTVIAFLLTAIGVILFLHKPRERKVTKLNHIGGYCLTIAFVLWMCVFISLFAQMIQWLWRHAP